MAGRHSAVKSQPRESVATGVRRLNQIRKFPPRYLGGYEKIEGPGTLVFPARAISTKNKHLLMIYSIPTRGFTAALSVFRGTPPPKPFDCTIWLNTAGAHFCDPWAKPTGGEPRLSRARFRFVSIDIIEMSPSSRSQMLHLSFRFRSFTGNKKPCFLSVSRVRKNLVLLLPAYLRFITIRFKGAPFIRPG